jgi:hypothetical protein
MQASLQTDLSTTPDDPDNIDIDEDEEEERQREESMDL